MQFVSLDDPTAADPAVTGGKAATLAALRDRGFPIPDGWVVTTDAYRELAANPAVEAARADLRDADTASARADAAEAVRDVLAARSLPDDVRSALEELPDGEYAVRSSATTEDLADASFAGQHETQLGVARDDLPDAVSACLASAYTDRAVDYRARNAVPDDAVAMAVLVQRMIEPDASGVLFTADPVSGSRRVATLDAGPGRGDERVTGRSPADSIRFDRDSGELTYAPGAGERVLSDDDVRALVSFGDRLADVLDSPQDVEWALRDGDISVLQSRPITALYPLPEPEPADGRVHVYYSFGHRQGMPDAMFPLVLDTWDQLLSSVGPAFGLSKRLAAKAGGRLYIDITAYLDDPWLRDRILRNFSVVDEPAVDALRDLLDSRPDDFPLESRTATDTLRALGSVRRVAAGFGTVLRKLPAALLRNDPTADAGRVEKTYATNVDRSLDHIENADSLEDRVNTAYDALLDSPRWLFEPFYAPFIAALVAGWALRRLCDPERVDALALGIRHDAVYRMTTDLAAVADTARGTPAADALRDGATLTELEDVGGAEAFREAFDEFLDDYGFRAVGEIDWSRPRYREDPTPLLHAVTAALDADPGRSDALEERARRAKRALVANAHPVVRPLVRRLATVYREDIGLREHPKFSISRLLDAVRTVTLEAGEELADAGALDAREDVWLLSLSELRDAAADPRTLVGVDFTARRRDHQRNQRLDPPRVVTSDGEIPRPPARTVGRALSGTGAAPGVVEGVVRVVTDPSAQRLRSGEILVAPYTDPGWTPLFPAAGAVVTEVGGRLTHGALVAREYGIPAVVAVTGATTRLSTGDRVRVDGTRGTVERLD